MREEEASEALDEIHTVSLGIVIKDGNLNEVNKVVDVIQTETEQYNQMKMDESRWKTI